MAAVALACCATLGFFGWKGSAATLALWDSYFSETPMGDEESIDALTRGINQWKLESLIQKRGILYRKLALRPEYEQDQANLTKRALNDFISSSELHPYDPTNHLNVAEALDSVGRNDEAEKFFRFAIRNQGEMEAAFHSNHRYANFLLRKGVREFDPKDTLPAITTFEIAIKHLEKAYELGFGHSKGQEGIDLSIRLYQNLGQAYEANKEYKLALAQYDMLVTKYGATSGHYYAGLMLGKIAVETWNERKPSEALRLFIEAEQRVNQATTLPDGVPPAKQVQYLGYLRTTIDYLEDSQIKPSESMDF